MQIAASFHYQEHWHAYYFKCVTHTLYMKDDRDFKVVCIYDITSAIGIGTDVADGASIGCQNDIDLTLLMTS